MRFILIGLLFYMLVTAYFAVQRVIRKRQLAKYSAQTSLQGSSDRLPEQISPSPQASSSSPASAGQLEAQPTEPQEAIEALLVENLASGQPEPSEMPASEPIPEVIPSEASVPAADEINAPAMSAPEIPEPVAPPSDASTTGTSDRIASDSITSDNIGSGNSNNIASEPSSPSLPIGSPMIVNPELDIPLAVSLSVSDIANSERSGTVEVPDLIPTDPAISEVLNANTEPASVDRPSILEEIAELRPIANADNQSSDPVSRFMHALQTGDGTVRVAAVYELGEIAAQRQGNTEQIIEQLQLLTEDEDPDVRLQAIAALAKVQG